VSLNSLEDIRALVGNILCSPSYAYILVALSLVEVGIGWLSNNNFLKEKLVSVVLQILVVCPVSVQPIVECIQEGCHDNCLR